MDAKTKLVSSLKHLSEYIGFIHDNHGVIESLNRQKTSTDSSVVKTLDNQVEHAGQILKNNQTKVLELLDEICSLAGEIDENTFRDCQKLDSDFKRHKTNPDLIQIQKDIKQIQADLK